ncbi:MAG TPA: PD-(D/E)XK nuclease family protein [Burkholderiales bacterium]
MPGAPISKSELFARLAEGLAAGITVVTPNKRLSQSLVADFDAFQTKKNLKVWEAADILPFDAFVQRLHEEALYSDLAAKLPLLLSPAQEQALWEEVIAGSGLLVIPQAAAAARDAWKLAHQWRLDGAIGKFPGNEDAAAFAAWAKKYQAKTKGDIDAARLPDLLLRFLKDLKRPKVLVAYAFDVLPPQTGEFLHKFDFVSCSPEKKDADSKKQSYPSAREEIEAAASWARTQLEEGKRRIGIVVPDLQQKRKQMVRVFARVLGTRQPFNVSVGMPLTQYPLVAQALLLLRFSVHEISYEEASRVIRSPFIGGAEAEMARRARLDADLRKTAPARLSLPKLIGLVESCPELRRSLEKIFSFKSGNANSPHEWARHFTALLEAAGFPGERALDSIEFQSRQKLNEILAEFARLERVSQKMSSSSAISKLEYLCNDALFQPESPEAPVQVLGLIESAGLEFDALWVSGLTDDAWPLGAKPNPFIPPALQRKAGIPQATAEQSLIFGQRVTAGWQSAAPEVVFSWPAMEEDRALIASPLISRIPQGTPKAKSYEKFRDLIFAARRLESIPDGQAPALATPKPKGGTGILADQAACPFRAFARWRLGARELEEPAEGLDARARGSLLHALMKHLWGELKDSRSLQRDNSLSIEKAAAAAVAELELEGRFAELEKKRLAKLAREWLEVEKERPAFTVIKIEEKLQLSVSSLQFSGRIDRMDALESGGHALIDYKTGNPTPNDWKGPRPEEPQLPLYALSVKEAVTAVAFAKLKTGGMRYMGFSKNKNTIPLVKQAEDWDTLRAGWKKDIDALGAGFASGDARVDPKKLLATCRYCDLQTLCRVFEKINNLGEDEVDE